MTGELRPELAPSRLRRRTYNLPEVAEMLGCSYSSVYRWAQQGEIPTVRVGRRVLVPREALDDLLTPTGGDDETSGF